MCRLHLLILGSDVPNCSFNIVLCVLELLGGVDEKLSRPLDTSVLLGAPSDTVSELSFLRLAILLQGHHQLAELLARGPALINVVSRCEALKPTKHSLLKVYFGTIDVVLS